jgi:hypothetical protein
MSALAALALQSGFPVIRSILERKLGDANGALAGDVLAALAARANVKPAELEALAEATPGKVIDAMRAVEPMTPELIALYAKGLEHQNQLLMAEQEEGGWKANWRPLGMYFVMALWAWQVIVLHVANAIWKIALPPMPWEHLVTFTGLYMGLYMGGHTIKDVATKVMGAGK